MDFHGTDWAEYEIDLLRALDTLTPKQRAVFCMYFVAGHTQAEIGAMYGVSHQAIDKQLKGILAEMRQYCGA